ncbi:MAG: electron transport complex subunit RsxC [Oceanospirillaceae bacterium]|nr:electron transport complex subunit RsxC [Oceanospirillaceae bacterium]
MKLRDHKQLSSGKAIRRCPTPAIPLAIPLEQGRSRALPCVKPGERVLKGQVIGIGDGRNLWVHASTSGIVQSIGPAAVADRNTPAESVFIAADGKDEWIERQSLAAPRTVTELARYAMRMGLAGLGGAGFPTGLKLAGAERTDFLLINGAECEPFLTCDDALMRERADTIIQAADFLAALLGAGRTLIGVEGNKPEAIAALKSAIARAGSDVRVKRIPERYPAGGQPMLVRALCGRRLRPGQLPGNVGVQVLNVASLHALGRAVFAGEPLISRIVTLTGSCSHPGNVEVPIGLPVTQLAGIAGAVSQDIHVGGPMMGRALDAPEAVVSKTTSCLIYGAATWLPRPEPAGDCIRCNRCVDVCPMALQPMSLYTAAREKQMKTLKMMNLDACIECGACSLSCPARLPLRDSFRESKRELRQ